MKIITLILGLILSSSFLFCQEIAITQSNDTVFLYPNGTWSYELLDENPEFYNELSYLETKLEFDTLKQQQVVSKGATKSLKNKFDLFEIKYNPSDWKRSPPAQFNDEAEFALVGRDLEIYCIVISEEIGVGLENLPKIAMQTMQENTGTELTIKKNEIRVVNGVPLVRSVFDIELSGMKLTFDSYYYSSDKGTVQFTTWTGSNLWEKYEQNIVELLNGLLINE